MARLARIVIPNLPHLVTQRGNRRETVFYSDEDYAAYLELLSDACRRAKTEIWAWCLMPNHVHLVLVPKSKDGLRRCLSAAHRAYAMRINARNEWTGHLWQGRFGSVVMDEDHLYRAIAYVALNPVRARLCKRPRQWKWSSVHVHLSGKADGFTQIAPVLERTGDFAAFLKANHDDEEFDVLRRAETIGRPIGSDQFLKKLERRLKRPLKPGKRGPKPKVK